MRRISKTTLAILFSLLFAAVISFTVFTAPVLAEESDEPEGQIGPKTKYLDSVEASGVDDYDEYYDFDDYDNYDKHDKYKTGRGVHADPATFEKNFCLSAAQKEYAITEIERVVSRIIDPNMSDLEKYYRLAVWENKRAKYDWHFWSGRYYFELYRHQWDSYGVLTDKSVCAGIAITYAVLCHAADLPCKFVRTDPEVVDHTVNYIPDINGHSYSVDVTENTFLMSEYSSDYFEMDKTFAGITDVCDDMTFDYSTERYPDLFRSTNIKDCYKISYSDWFNEYALHEKVYDAPYEEKKLFNTEYEENGSGKTKDQEGYHHASYTKFNDYPAQTYDSRDYDSAAGQPTGIWFLDDFYVNPTGAYNKIKDKEFDEQFLEISGLEESYDCESIDELQEIIEGDLAIKYFPSYENGEVVAWADDLKHKADYRVEYVAYDGTNGEAVFAIKGVKPYKGAYMLRVKLNNIENAKVELSKKAFTYNGKVQKPSVETIKGMEVEDGKDYVVAWSNANSKNAGTYTMTIHGKGIYSGTTKATYKINKAANPMKLKAKTAKVKRSKLKKKAQTIQRAEAITVSKAQGKTSYKLVSAKKDGKSFSKKFKINAKTGNVTVKKGLKKGKYNVKVKVKAAGNGNYKASAWKPVTFTVRVK